MTVRELIEILLKAPNQNAEVFVDSEEYCPDLALMNRVTYSVEQNILWVSAWENPAHKEVVYTDPATNESVWTEMVDRPNMDDGES